MDEIDNILYDLGYVDSDPLKKEQVQRYVEEAKEYMADAGVSADKIDSHRAYAIKSLWASYRDEGSPDKAVRKEGMIVHLITQLRR
jgi:hypothetical protein